MWSRSPRMNRIDATFKNLRRQKKKALIAYLTVGFPSMSLLPKLVDALVEGGIDLLELGIPFSDPLADGPTIQAASNRALRQGVTPSRVFQAVRQIRRRGVQLPVVLLTYANPVFQYGVGRFCRACRSNGVDGLIVVDCPPEEAKELIQAARAVKVATIFLAAPTSTRERLKKIVKASSGFIYYVSLTGVTGVRKRLAPEIARHVRSLQRMTPLPVCVGFGISTPAQVREVAKVADGVIVGSALLSVIGRASGSPARQAKHFIRRLKTACHP